MKFIKRKTFLGVRSTLTFESVNELLWCHLANETSPAVLLPLLEVKGLRYQGKVI